MINLKKLSNKDITEKYLKWMNDKKVHQYTEQRHSKHSIKKIKKFVSEKNKSKNEFLFGIYLKNQHIGNIKLGPINNIHKYAFISYFIGERNLNGKGYATIAIKKIISIAKKKKIKKLKAGVYAMNIGSQKALKKNGFIKEGVLKKEYIFKRKRINCFLFGKVMKN